MKPRISLTAFLVGLVAMASVAIDLFMPGLGMALLAFTLPTGYATHGQYLKALSEQRAAKAQEMQAIIDKAATENRGLTEAEQKQYDQIAGERDRLKKTIEMVEESETELRKKPALPISPTGERKDVSEQEERDISKFSFMKVVRAAANQGKMDGLEEEMAQEARNEMQHAGVSSTAIYQIPLMVLQRAKVRVEKRDVDATSGGGTAGGYNVATELRGYIDALRESSRVTALGAEYITGAVGNIDMPRENAVFTPGWRATENAAASESSPTYTKVTFTPKSLTGYIDVSNQLLAQAAIGFEARLRNQLLQGQGEAIDQGAINGSGSSGQPEGILNTSGIGSVVGGTNGAAPDRDDLVDLITELGIDKALRGALAYLSTPQVFGKLAKTKTDSGSGIFVLDQMRSFMGYPFAVSNNVPSNLDKGTSTGVCSAIIFGNFNDLMIVQWGGLEILPDPYTQRVNNLTRIHVNSYVDIHALRAVSFAAMKDALTT
jgi:HK97 family phage major capsid protein